MFIKKLGKVGGHEDEYGHGGSNGGVVNKTRDLNRDGSKTTNNVSILKCFYTNAHSLRNKKDELVSYAIAEDLDIICITEAWINELFYGDSLHEYEIDGYSFYLYQRRLKMGGGVALYVRSNIQSVLRTDCKSNQDVESVWVDLFTQTKSYKIGAFYRPPDQSQELDVEMVKEIETACCDKGKDIVIMGDFNFPDIHWDPLCNTDHRSSVFVNCILDNFLSQMVHEPTRHAALLDLILTNEESLVDEVKVDENLGVSDHNIIRFNLNVLSEPRLQTNNVKVLDFRSGNFNNFRDMLNEIDWDKEFEDLNCYMMWKCFKKILMNIQSACFRDKPIRKANRKPVWWNREISEKIKVKHRCFKAFKDSSREEDLVSYRNSRNELNQVIRRAKRVSEISLARNSNKDPKTFFRFYKFKNKNRTIGPIKINGNFVSSDKELVNILNTHFVSKFTEERLDDSLGSEVSDSHMIDRLEEFEFEVQKIEYLLNHIDPSKAAGPDGICGRILKEGSSSIAKALYLIFNRSITYSEVPEEWKMAYVVPIYKKGSKGDLDNYRPVSLTSLVVKVLEKLLKGRIEKHLEDNKILKDSQHGFRKGRSCQTNLLEFMEYITGCIDQGDPVDVIYLDFSRAFDKVPHRRLMHKLIQCGIGGGIHGWIKEWLWNRKQCVILNGNKSLWEKVKSGVPQGSVLGPLLFLIYINDLDQGIKCKVSKFADDTKVATSVKNINGCINIQNDLNKLLGWADKWQMNFNSKKCKVLHLGHSNKGFNYDMNGEWLQSVDQEKDLGVIISSDLKVGNQCLEARNKANKMLGIINRNVCYKSKEVISKLYNSYVRPLLEYCSQVWAPYLRKDIEMLESVQRRATRMISGFEGKSYKERLKELGMYSVERRFLRGDMIQVFKIFKSFDNIETNKFFTVDHGSVTRGHNKKIKKRTCHLDIRKYSFGNRVVNFWNGLPQGVVSSDSLATFKKSLDRYMDSLEIV